MAEDLKEKCSRCGHERGEHAEYVDNMLASTSYVPERRHCLHGSKKSSKTTVFGCDCTSFKTKRNGHGSK